MGGPGGGQSIVMPPPPGDLGGQKGAPPYGPGGPAAGGTVPNISQERRPGMPKPTMHAMVKAAGLTEEDISDYDALSDAEIDEHIDAVAKTAADIQFRMSMRQNNFEKKSKKVYATEDLYELPIDSTLKITIDKVPPKFRKEYWSSDIIVE
jgi:hypothetical protein